MEEFFVENLVLIITKECNLKCKHCCRGESESSYMTDETIENIFKKINKIGKLTISGGEPLLSRKTLDIIVKIVQSIKNNNVSVNNVQIVTNGTIYSDEMDEVLKDLYAISRYNYYNSLIISDDIFHHSEIDRLGLKERVEANITSFKNLAKELQINFNFNHLHGIEDSGRAKQLDVEKFERDDSEAEDFIRIGLLDKNIKELSISDDGKVTFFCTSYNEILGKELFNINKTNNVFNEVQKYFDNLPISELYERYSKIYKK